MGRKLTPEEIYQYAHLQRQNQFLEEEPPKRKEKRVKPKKQWVQREDIKSVEPAQAEQATQEIEVPSHPAEGQVRTKLSSKQERIENRFQKREKKTCPN